MKLDSEISINPSTKIFVRYLLSYRVFLDAIASLESGLKVTYWPDDGIIEVSLMMEVLR